MFRKSKVGHGSKSCGNNTCRCSDRGVALARGGGGRSARLIWPTDTSTAWNGTCSGQGRRGAGRGILCGVHYAHRAPGNSSGNFHGRSQKSWAMFHRRYQNSFQGHQLFVLPKQCRCEPKLMSKPNCHSLMSSTHRLMASAQCRVHFWSSAQSPPAVRFFALSQSSHGLCDPHLCFWGACPFKCGMTCWTLQQ